MLIKYNSKIKRPVTKAVDEKGFSLAGLWRRYIREGGKYSYSTFSAVASGRLRVPKIVDWLIKEGYGKELAQAQETQKDKQNGGGSG